MGYRTPVMYSTLLSLVKDLEGIIITLHLKNGYGLNSVYTGYC